MTHPSDATLALYAGKDLKWLDRRRTERHLARCPRCRSEVDAYASVREETVALGQLPGLSWNRLAAEMKANIRLGLAAGECVREPQAEHAPAASWMGTRALVTYASLAALVAGSVLLERPVPHARGPVADSVTVEATANGIETKGGGQALSLLHGGAGEVTVTASAQGSMRARYVDSETDCVTINSVYAQ